MTLKQHMTTGGVAAVALWPVFGAGALVFWLASFLIDLDHYIDYLYHNGFRDFSVRRMFDYHDVLMRSWMSPEFINLEIFHTVEFMALLLGAAYVLDSGLLMAVFWGFLFHNALDVAFLLKTGIVFKRAYSFTEFFIRRRRMEAAGLRPSELYFDAARKVSGSGLGAAKRPDAA